MRYEAVERVTVVFRFLPDNVWRKNSASVKSVLSHAFCCFIACMDDLTAQVSQQATLMLGMVKVSHCFTEYCQLNLMNVSITKAAFFYQFKKKTRKEKD